PPSAHHEGAETRQNEKVCVYYFTKSRVLSPEAPDDAACLLDRTFPLTLLSGHEKTLRRRRRPRKAGLGCTVRPNCAGSRKPAGALPHTWLHDRAGTAGTGRPMSMSDTAPDAGTCHPAAPLAEQRLARQLEELRRVLCDAAMARLDRHGSDA